MHRRDGQRRSTIACRQPAGFAMGRSRYSRRTAVLSTGSVAGCRLKFFKAEGLLICRTDALKNRGNRKNPLRARAEDFCFSGAGVKGNAMPIVRGAGGETSGAGQGRQTLVWAQGRCSSGGRAFSADRSGAETDVSCSGSRAESPAQLGCCLRQPLLGITCRKCLTKTPGSRGRGI